jgi:hypothetical protein
VESSGTRVQPRFLAAEVLEGSLEAEFVGDLVGFRVQKVLEIG